MKSVQQQIVSGVFFTAVAKYSNLLVSLCVTAVLARLLAPDEFGVIAVAMLTISFLNIVADIGLLPAVIQYRDLEKKELGVLFSVSCYIGLVLTLLLFFGSYLIAGYYGQPLLRSVIQLLSVSLFFNAIAVVPNALFYREQLFRPLAIRSFIIQVIGGVFAVIAAYAGAGVYALVINPILSSLLLFLISYLRFPLAFQLRFSIRPLKHVFRYSTYQFLFNIINYFSRNADTLLIGRYLGMSPLGYYDKAYQLMSLPLQNITQVITPVMHPILSSQSGDSNKLVQANEQLARVLAVIGFPLSVFLYFSAEELVFLLFGSQWKESIPVFEVLSMTVGTQLVLSSSGSIFQASGHTKHLFICGLFSALINVTGVLFGVFYFESIVAVARCLALTFAVNFILTYWFMYSILLRSRFSSFLAILVKPLLFSILLGGCLYLYVGLFHAQEASLYKLFLNLATFTVTLFLFVWYGGYRIYIQSFIKSRKNV